MKVQIRQCVLDAIAKLRKAHTEYESDEVLLQNHANADGKWNESYASLNGVPVKDLALVLAGHYRVIDPVEEAIRDNPVLHRVQNILHNQTIKGIEKYGTSVQSDDLSTEQWIDHASEEAADMLVYLQALKEKVKDTQNIDSQLALDLRYLYADTLLYRERGHLENFNGRMKIITHIAKIYDIKLEGE